MSAQEVMSSDEWDIVKAALIRRINGVRSISSFPNVRQADLALETADGVIDIVIEALDAAGFLATEQQFVCEGEPGDVFHDIDEARWFAAMVRDQSGIDYDISTRRVTPWRSA